MTHLLLWVLAVVLLIITCAHAARAHAERNESRNTLALVTQQASELVRLRHTARDSSLPVRPDGGLTGKVSQTLSRSGLATSVMQSLSPESESSNQGVVRQHATLTLSGVTLPQIGKFLDAWRTKEPDWVVSGLDLSPVGTGTPGADLPLRAAITIDAMFKEKPRPVANMRPGAPR